jgi:hypothetical protein
MTDTAIASAPAEITGEREFLELIRARQQELNLSYRTLDAVIGLPDNYASKLFSGIARFGALTFWPVLNALGYKMVLVEDPGALARTKAHPNFQPSKGVAGGSCHS